MAQVGRTGANTPRRVLASARRAASVPVCLLAAVALSACGGGDGIRDEAGVVVSPGPWSVFALQPGDCLDPDPSLTGEVADITVVPCAEPHLQEVFGTVQHPKGAYPGTSEVAAWADGACLDELESEHGLTLDDGLFVNYLLPTFVEWSKNDDRNVVCVLVFPDRDDATGSVVAGTARVERSVPVDPQVSDVEALGGDA